MARFRATAIPPETWGMAVKAFTDFDGVDKDACWDCCNDILSYSGNFVVPKIKAAMQAEPAVSQEQALVAMKDYSEGKVRAGGLSEWLAIIKILFDILSKLQFQPAQT